MSKIFVILPFLAIGIASSFVLMGNKAKSSDEVLLKMANKHFANHDTKISLPNGKKITVEGRERDLIRVELYKRYLAKKLLSENPSLRKKAEEEFREGSPLLVKIVDADALTGLENVQEFSEPHGKRCRLTPTKETRKAADLIESHPCLRPRLEKLDGSKAVSIESEPLTGARYAAELETHWKEVATQHFLASRGSFEP